MLSRLNPTHADYVDKVRTAAPASVGTGWWWHRLLPARAGSPGGAGGATVQWTMGIGLPRRLVFVGKLNPLLAATALTAVAVLAVGCSNDDSDAPDTGRKGPVRPLVLVGTHTGS
ncbi:hypothetical protein [Streptomyces sp. WELS2]|uniref:hypothetical protein n=1 Tax=Streptomyces sp. WELS2 TaxID=2749435 RepID=UPI00215DA0B3|nr:hypothetical protein [Streptomyces sp. WELS2]